MLAVDVPPRQVTSRRSCGTRSKRVQERPRWRLRGWGATAASKRNGRIRVRRAGRDGSWRVLSFATAARCAASVPPAARISRADGDSTVWGRPEAAKLGRPTPKQRALLTCTRQRIRGNGSCGTRGALSTRMAVRANVDAQQWQRGGGAGAAPDASLLAEAGTGTLDANVPTMADFQRRHARRRGTAWTHSRKLSPEMLADNDGDEEEGGSGGARHSPTRSCGNHGHETEAAPANSSLTTSSIRHGRAWRTPGRGRRRTIRATALAPSLCSGSRRQVTIACTTAAARSWSLWDEGRTSEFGPFGIGVVLYFKFAKWLSWVFFVLSLLWLPAIVTNTYGIGVPGQSGTAWLAMTTIGNLGDSVNNSAVTMPAVPRSSDHRPDPPR